MQERLLSQELHHCREACHIPGSFMKAAHITASISHDTKIFLTMFSLNHKTLSLLFFPANVCFIACTHTHMYTLQVTQEIVNSFALKHYISQEQKMFWTFGTSEEKGEKKEKKQRVYIWEKFLNRQNNGS